MNWKVFGQKYDKREQWAFEQMSYLLFCAEFSNKIGLFRYKNQTGIETEPLEKDGAFYGFQAKYYTTSISDNKEDIIDSVKKAKSKNTQLTELLIYTNQELSESTKKNKKKPQYQVDIEKYANVEGVNIHWRVPSHFELQLALPENKYLHDIFFSTEPNEGDLLDKITQHNENILKVIQTEIPFEEKQIKIDRSSIIAEIKNACQEKKNIIISGEGGCGKTAVLKEFYALNRNETPICIFKANELNVAHINDIFQFDNKFTLTQFLNAYKDEPIKTFVIDSAEKLAEMTNNEILITLTNELIENGWNIIFTTRYAYLNDLKFRIKENSELSFEISDVSLISIDELKSISIEFDFSLPEKQEFTERLKNLFYLNEYIREYINIDKQSNFKGFINLLWKKRIQNNIIQKDNLHLERERCIISIVKQRCDTGRFYINADNLPQSVLFQLKQDEILGYDEVHSGYFITHDIYEEWTLDKIISRCFSNYSNIKQFFDELGNSLPMRRAFRVWLSDHLADSNTEIENFIHEVFINNEISQFWKDETLISVLLSDYSEMFFNLFENEIVAYYFTMLKRILFLLRIACTDIYVFESIDISKPKGKGWEEVISLIYKYKSHFFENNLKLISPILTIWCDLIKIGKTTRYCGLLALSIIQKTETEERFYMNKDVEEKIQKVIFNSANEIQSELRDIFDKVITNEWINHNKPYNGLCLKILEKPYIAIMLIGTLPLYVIQLCHLFWQSQERKSHDCSYSSSMETRYGLIDKFKYKCFPASGNQTPIKWLLQVAFHETLDFIIDFTNKAVESYSQSDYGKNDVKVITLHIGEIEVTQYLSSAIWEMYRGTGSPAVPNLLQSIHMGLEKTLLKLAQVKETEIIQNMLLKILVKSKSTSLTSIVCSVVLANSDKLYDIALILFKTIELFHFDTMRCTNESQAKSLYSIGYGMDKIKDILYADERLKTCENKHRNLNLESLFLNYQFCGIKGFAEEQNTEFIEKLYNIIDQYKINDLKNKLWEPLLSRIDRRNLKPIVLQHADNNFLVEFTPREVSEELKKKKKLVHKESEEAFKYFSLYTWSNFLLGEKSQKYEEYNNNPFLALSKTKQLINELNNGRNLMGVFDYNTPAFSCSKLMIEHIDKLQTEDKHFCKEIILSTLSQLYTNKYDHQIGDGVEACFHAIPSLIKEYPNEKDIFIEIMLLALFHEASIGAHKRICDYVIESIHKSKLWEQNQTVAQEILFNYIKLKPSYKNIIAKKEGYSGQLPKGLVLEELKKINTGFTFESVSFHREDIDSLDIYDLEIVYQIIPSNTNDNIHLDIYTQTLPLVASKLLMDSRISLKDYFEDDSRIYLLRLHIFKTFSNFILQREKNEIDKYLKPFLDYLSPTEETASFISELIMAEDMQNNDKQFWYIWNNLYSKIKELCFNPRNYYLKEIIINYLLAWRWWREGSEEWHSLKSENLSFYTKVSREMGHIPSVLYSIVRVLNTIGTNFRHEGIDWVYTITSNNKSLELDDLESNTLYYLEIYLKKFIFNNRQNIKKEIRLKSKIIPILDFMIERGSIHGYLLRESIL